MNILSFSSYPPKFCGVAEFNQDIIINLRQRYPQITFSGIAINESDSFVQGYPSYVTFQIRKNILEDYLQAADYVNKSSADVVLMQHEFGLYGGFAGKYVLKFVEQIRKPIVCVAHTIPIRSDAHKPIAKRNFFIKSAPYIHKYITIMPDGADKLISYGIPEHKVVTIEHGAPDILSYSNKDLRKVLHLPEHNTIIFNFGLLHRRKGIVYAVEAMKYIKEKKLRATLLLITVPLRGAENIAYVEELKKVITSNNLTDYVMIKECYLNKEDLYKYINTADIAILPYIYKSYISSGPLSFFISALKPIITTPFAYASYMLTKESAYFVPYANSFAISKAIEDLILHRDKKTAIISHMKPIRESILWSNQVTKYYAVLKDVTHK